ncbi:MAG: DNA polymerase III subunit delta' [Nitrospirae bacterium CG02_land_8_20_14_3_00_44_33]|nr:MAG: DNA polymerase III subunit delta' [Nitrospirae bacterium CG1_02_44_142]PIV42661.1 MAG: DNA polymerase III subunit delta' [Nitrospirae bacterium CG02_land_8_20_14_3_00_44_33]PIV65436.1 MAG: DNA polymerase III subunit delta' [Nitrospirae bacterium CG01_land_8_20_14_3_00_44_22]PIW88894.1 MAG: DNA polymerase III subunit delta' [Nitrospirae bacterium CG_4_8_14_3_um_filter_44_28]PJA82143.1 MAG: DNA polymerase III subunit delta' [Nitrospirae bacterium CG_4_9_14_3_um_filter_44_28]
MALKNIIGQKKAINILLGTMGRNRMPSAYLFAGESGIGKKLTAINLAKTLNCQKDRNALSVMRDGIKDKNSLRITDYGLRMDACDECPSCKKIDSGIHPDFIMAAPEKGEIRVDEIRAIEEAISLAPYEGKRKVVIVDDAETMNPSAANAFLKTLEEPPPQSIIILISASPDRLPETIRSRCSRINFSPLTPEQCKEVIGAIDNQEREITDSQLSTLSRLSMGRPGLAISSDLMEERDWFFNLLGEMSASSASGGLGGGKNKETWADKEEMELWFNKAFMLLRDIAVLKITGKSDMLINIDLKDRFVEMSKAIEMKDIINIYGRLSFLKGYLGFNLNKAITWNYVTIIIKGLGFRF